jgi:hypothetical protein
VLEEIEVTLTISSLDVSGSSTTMKSSVDVIDAGLIPPSKLVALATTIEVAVVVKEPTTSVSRETLEYFLDISLPYIV